MPVETTGGMARPDAAALPPDTQIPVMLPLAYWAMLVEAVRDHYPAPRGRTEDLWSRLTQQLDHQVDQAMKARAEDEARALDDAVRARQQGEPAA